MRSERGLQAAIGVVLAFSLLWTIAILVPDPGASRNAAAQGLVVNGTRYVLDSNVDPSATGSSVHIIHSYASTATAQKTPTPKGSSTTTQRRLQSQPSLTRTSGATTNGTSSSKKRDPLLPRWAWFSLVVVFNASRFVKKKKREEIEEEDWFMKSGLDTQLQYMGVRKYEEDFLSVDGSMYGSMSQWSGDECDKFDMC